MRLLTRQSIEERLAAGDLTRIAIDPILHPAQLGEVTLDLRLGTDFLVSILTRRPSINAATPPGGGGAERVRGTESYFRNTRREFGDKFTLYPGQIVLGTSLEYVGLPADVFADILTRSSLNRLGITLSTMIQPGFRGCIPLELFNHGNIPVEVVVGARIVQARFFETDRVGDYQRVGSNRKYYGNVRPVVSRSQYDGELRRLSSIRDSGHAPS